MKMFFLQRDEDVTGVSGTGRVAEGVEFSDGSVAIRWYGSDASTVMWDSIEAATRIHGHDGKTRFVHVWNQTV